MTCRETVLTIACEGETLVGILAATESKARLGVVIVVGGPQYRAGSHRQFTLLARHLAASGFPTLRFDYRGMGDSGGEPVDFESTGPDIAAAVDALTAKVPGLQGVVLWGLCDAASAALLYVRETRDPRIAGLCLLNPWVRSEVSYARTEIKHYYARRLLDMSFWRKLLGGGVKVGGALREAGGKFARGFAGGGSPVAGATLPFQRRMADAVERFDHPILLVLSENDLTAQEFRDYAAREAPWRLGADRGRIRRVELRHADHTFSCAAWRQQVELACEDWLGQIEFQTGLRSSAATAR